MSLAEQILSTARSARVVFPEGADERVVAAAEALEERGICQPILLTEVPGKVPAHFVDAYLAKRPGARRTAVEKRLQRPVYHASMMVASGEADALVAGAVLPTKQVLEAARLCIGTESGVATPSSCFLMDVPGWREPLVFADCAVNVAPDARTLADIAVASARSAERLLGVAPRVALVSFSTHGSGRHESVQRIGEALELIREAVPGLAVDGELQVDAALDAAVARRKANGDSLVAGAANVLIFPDLNSGNIAYKLVQQLAGASVIGPLLQGFARPVADLSRGAGVEEIVLTTAATLC